MEESMPLDNSERATRVLLFFKILAGLDLLWIFASLLAMTKSESYWGLDKIGDGLPFGIGEEFYLPNIYNMFDVFFLLLNIAIVVFFIQWFRRSYNNLHKLGIKDLSYTEGWAAGAWFVPIVNLFRPFIIMNEIWVVTQQVYTSSDEELSKEEKSLYLVNIWWSFWIISLIFEIVLLSLETEASYLFDIGYVLIEFVYIYYTYKLISQSNIHQQLLFEHQKVKRFGKIEKDKNFE
jgi:hypothetical protein